MKGIRVLFIAGWGRSGTTVLGNILGQIPGLTAVGELQYFWERNVAGGYLCGCGKSVFECPFWTDVVNRGWGTAPPTPRHMIQWHQRFRTRHLPLFAAQGAAERYSTKSKPYLDQLRIFYHAISETSRSDVIVDGSKAPAYAYALSLIPGIDLSVLLMVRDPRGVAYSWLRPKVDAGGSGTPMKRFGAATSSLLWSTWNLATEKLLRPRAAQFAFLRYEDFVSRPQTTVRRIVSWLGLDRAELPFSDSRTAVLSPTHTSSGNPNRHHTGPVSIRLDERWRSHLPAGRRALVTTLCWPLMRRYGYLGGGLNAELVDTLK